MPIKHLVNQVNFKETNFLVSGFWFLVTDPCISVFGARLLQCHCKYVITARLTRRLGAMNAERQTNKYAQPTNKNT